MTEFLQEIQTRIGLAHQSLDEARRDGDDYLIQIRTGELESLERLEAAHREEELAS
ncbi:MAG: hypothetical protein ACXV4A_03110 [Actinomycetes bacterium]